MIKTNDGLEVNVDIKSTIKGEYQDEIIRYDEIGRIVEKIVTPIRHNIITVGISTLVAGLIQGFYAGNNSFWAVGIGSQTQSPNLATLVNEYTRKQCTISFVDQNNAITTSPTNRIMMTASWVKGELSQGSTVILTEFGIFSGFQANLPNSGLMMDYVPHAPLSIDDTLSLSRKIYFTF